MLCASKECELVEDGPPAEHTCDLRFVGRILQSGPTKISPFFIAKDAGFASHFSTLSVKLGVVPSRVNCHGPFLFTVDATQNGALHCQNANLSLVCAMHLLEYYLIYCFDTNFPLIASGLNIFCDCQT
jgi:hypothetical protein